MDKEPGVTASPNNDFRRQDSFEVDVDLNDFRDLNHNDD